MFKNLNLLVCFFHEIKIIVYTVFSKKEPVLTRDIFYLLVYVYIMYNSPTFAICMLTYKGIVVSKQTFSYLGVINP